MRYGPAMTQIDRDRYTAAMHAVQTGIAYIMEKDLTETQPKHLRVGISSSMVTELAVAELLIAKGIFTGDEYEKALADAAEREVGLYAERVNSLYVPEGSPTKITLA